MSTPNEPAPPAGPLFSSELARAADRPFIWSPQARPLSGLRTWAKIGLIAAIVASVMMIIGSAGSIYFESLVDPVTYEIQMDETAWGFGYGLVGLISLIGVVVYYLGLVLIAVFHSRFVFRAANNLIQSKARNIDFSASWAVWVHYIPIISFWMPIGKVGRIWAASHAPQKPTSQWPMTIGWWWGLFVGSNLLNNLSLRFYSIAEQQGDIATMIFTYWLDIVSWTVTIVSCVLLLGIHRQIDEAQARLQSQFAPAPAS